MRGINLRFIIGFLVLFVGLGFQTPSEARECSLYLRQSTTLTKNKPQRYRFSAYNVYNLFLRTGKYVWTEDGYVLAPDDSDYRKEKPEHQVHQLAKTIKKINADFMVLTEVEGPHSLDLFIADYLDYKYDGYTSPSNDVRDLRISLIVKKNSGLKVDLVSFEALRFFNPITEVHEPHFVRNLPFFIISDEKTNKPLVAIVGIHFKSKRNRSRDENSTFKRASEAEKTAELVREFKAKNPHIPLMIMGDFNAEISSPEFAPIRELNFKDPFDTHFVDDPKKLGRPTHTYFPTPDSFLFDSMDYALIDPAISKGIVKAYVHRYSDKKGKIKNPPKNIQERNENPSDHYPIVFDIDI